MTNYTLTIHFIVCSVFSSQVTCSKHNTKDNKDKRSWIPYLKLTPVFCINFPILHASFSTHYPETMLLLLSLRSLQKCTSLSVNTITSHDLGKEIVFVKFSSGFRLICWYYLFLRWKLFLLRTITLKNYEMRTLKVIQLWKSSFNLPKVHEPPPWMQLLCWIFNKL